MNALGYPRLQPKTPVPSDIEVSQQIVREVGLLPLADLAKQYVTNGGRAAHNNYTLLRGCFAICPLTHTLCI